MLGELNPRGSKRRGLAEAVGELHLRFTGAAELFAVRVVKIDNHAALLRPLFQGSEQDLLGREIVLHRAMVIQVIPGQIGEYPDVELQSMNTFLIQGVRANLHHARLATSSEHLSQHLL